MCEFIDWRDYCCLAVSHFCEHGSKLIAVDVGHKVLIRTVFNVLKVGRSTV